MQSNANRSISSVIEHNRTHPKIWSIKKSVDSEQNRIGLSSTTFDARFCSITEPNRMIGVPLGSVEFWFDFVRLYTPRLRSLHS